MRSDFMLWALGACVLCSACGGDDEEGSGAQGGAGGAGDGGNDAWFGVLRGELDSWVEDNGGGVSAAIVVDGELRYSAHAGLRQVGGNQAVTAETRFVTASLTKMITAAAVLSAVEDDSLNLNDPATTWVPEFALAGGADASAITLHHALTHTAGLPDWNQYSAPLAFGSCPNDASYLSAWFRDTATTPLLIAPGTLFGYTNIGYALAGRALEVADGAPYPDAIAARVLEPAGMSSATFDVAVATGGDHAVPHVAGANGSLSPVAFDTDACGALLPAGGLYATANDYAHFAEALLSETSPLLQPSSLAVMTKGHISTHGRPGLDYGYGIGTYTYKGLGVLVHTGLLSGATSAVVMVPERRFAAVVLFNHVRDASAAAFRLVDSYFDLADEPLPSLGIDPSTWDDLVGRYTDPVTFGTIEVTRAGDVLDSHLTGPDIHSTLTPVEGDAFTTVFNGENVDVLFWRDSGEAAQYVVTRAAVFTREP